MSDQTNIEQRLSTLEQTVLNLQNQINKNTKSDDWLENVIGSISDEETFLEALEYGKLFRQEKMSFEEINQQK
ncbi:transferase hexapeptide repeat containing protein [Geminocystis sp. GBBB08]|uniref:transferase hexapeptide repeat containing protein n=1 Tax=Geminocystis sp. GBBB08 TaxID=2604140 RepID=UPI0027E239F4|nr:transferase hexapeptide repeat containing protein [Geminocystis sp. GBBB08]MBL1208701.1 transferase hexapeptide repeat containing protein [Geminocystis sp. GBBB08]